MASSQLPLADPPFVPLALEEEDIATYAAIAGALGCSTEDCAEGFMMATPTARDAAVQLWGAVQRLQEARPLPPEARVTRDLQVREALEALKSLVGLNPAMMPLASLAVAGLRYKS
ncbi:polysaccharide deacetylase [Roseomonas sp. 18066]|uniref:polysaccharide deacetylase n=1 Tax=Roseomonas sp. 18066 TaxID=2681412 RepID=UPI001359A3CF|nr:polysaccharide deacetylase [Roseomonas sp. 18066]